ncbi:MAG: hypothetical protein KME64_30680 [Scytonematopsis contorta HA4267-MV1]|jgi:hypothetical protein|nr:hypothetical protein [Scytonematopsis contorta HA4267-MV1]
MFNVPNYCKSLFSLAIVPFIIAGNGINSNSIDTSVDTEVGQEIGQEVAQNTYTGWVATIWQRQPKRRPLISRSSGVCPISPGVVDTLAVWHDRPLFLWQSSELWETAQLIIREEETQRVIWTQQVNVGDKKAFYSGQEALKAGKTYQWQLSGTNGRSIIPERTFEIMSASERSKIETDLQALDKELKTAGVSQEQLAERKAEYFLNYQIKDDNGKDMVHPWSDIFQVLYEVEKPSASFVQKRETKISQLCQ